MKNEINIYFRYALIILLLVLVFLVIKPFLATLILSLILAYIIYPLHKILNKRMNETLSAGIITILLMIIIIIPFILLTNSLLNEAITIYKTTNIANLESLISSKFNIEINENIQNHIESITKNASAYLITKLSEFIISIPTIILNFFIMLFAIFFTLRDGNKLLNYFFEYVPIEESIKNRVIKRTSLTLKSLFYGNIVIAVLEGVIATIGFYILNVNSPITWGIIVMISGLIPGIGASIAWIPLSILSFLNGNLVNAICIALFGLIVISILIDNILKAKILSDKTDIHPLVLVIGVLGGVLAFGPIGILIGPLILSIFQLTLNIYIEVKEN